MYDVGNRESFEALDSWLEEISRDIGSANDLQGVVFAVCANKVKYKKKMSTLIIYFFAYFLNMFLSEEPLMQTLTKQL